MSPIAALPFVFQDGSSAPAASGSPSLALDIACLLIVLVSTWMGARRGTWWQFVRLLGLVATLSVARALAPRLSQGLVDVFSSLSPALANGPCSTNQLCLFDSYLNESGNAWFRSAVSPGCYPTGANGLDHLTYSVKNLTSKKMTVYHTSNCTDGGYGISYLYANTSGNLAYPWNGGNTADHLGVVAFRVP